MAALAAGTGAESKTTAQTGRNRYPPPCIDDAAHLDLVYAPSEEEREALAKFDEAHGEEFVDVLPGKRLRFLRARDLELDKAVKMLRNHMKWFKEQAEQLVEEDINEKAINSVCGILDRQQMGQVSKRCRWASGTLTSTRRTSTSNTLHF